MCSVQILVLESKGEGNFHFRCRHQKLVASKTGALINHHLLPKIMMVNVSYTKLSYYIWKLRYYCARPLELERRKFTGPPVWNYDKV